MIIRRPVNESSGSYPTKCAIERLAHCRLMAVALVSARAVPALPRFWEANRRRSERNNSE